MSLKNIKKTKTVKESDPIVVEIDPEEADETSVEKNEPVDLGTLGNYFDIARNNYFEANRTIFIVGPITWEIGIHVIQKLSFYGNTSKEPITIYISSPGGECDAGFAIIDCINEMKRKNIEVNTICMGSCSSMASVILACGTIGKRFAFPSSRIMIHQAGIEAAGGRLNDINIIQHELQVWTDNMNKIFKKQTGKSLDELKTLTSYDNYMSASEAKKLGLIDAVKTRLV